MKRPLQQLSVALAAGMLLPLSALATPPASTTTAKALDREAALRQAMEAPAPEALQRFEARKSAPDAQMKVQAGGVRSLTGTEARWQAGQVAPATGRTSSSRTATPQSVAGWYMEQDSVMTSSGGAMRNYTARLAAYSGSQGNVQVLQLSGTPFTGCYATVSGSTISIPAGNYCPVSNSSGATAMALVCPLDPAQMIYDPKGVIKGTIADDGTITLPSWGIFVVDSTGSSASIVQGNYATTLNRANGVMSGTRILSGGNEEFTYPVRISQPNSNRLIVENFGNTGLPVFVNVTYNGRLELAPQYMGTTMQYGALSCMRMKTNSNGSYSGVSDTIITAQLGQGNVIDLPDWGIFADANPSVFLLRMTDATLTVDGFNLQLPPKFPTNFSGSGTETSPYLIKSYTDLMALQQQVREENPAKGLYYRLDADIDCAGQSYYFTPIGFMANNDDYALRDKECPGNPFTGHFDGNGHTIRGIDYECGHQGGTGVFSWIGPDASVSNLTVSGSTFYSEGVGTGAIAGYNEGEILNCKSVGNNVMFTDHSGGGIAGASTGLIEECMSSSVLRGYGSMGSMAGTCTGSVRNCDGRGSVTHFGTTSSLYDYTGGMIGSLNGSWSREGYPATAEKNVCATVVQDRTTGSTAGGFIGSTVSNSSKGNVLISGNVVIATVASAATSIQTGPTTNGYVGGMLGSWWRATLLNNVVTGLVMAPATTQPKYCGAVFGYIMSDANNKVDGLISTCQITTSNKTPDASLAIFSGLTSTYVKYLNNVYYDKQITGLDYTANSFAGAKTTAELTTGTALTGLDTEKWTFTKDLYPMLTDLRSNSGMQVAAAPVFLQNGENMTMVKANFPLSTLNGVKWGILTANGLSTTGVGLDIVNGQAVLKNEFAQDILCAYQDNGPYLREVVINTIPSKMWAGSGTAEDPYQIKTVNDLKNLAEATTTQGLTYENTYFKVMNDINVGGDTGFEGIAADGNTKHEFSGTFDGDGHTIDGVVLDKSGYDATGKAVSSGSMQYAGFIGRLNAKGVIKNLTLGANCTMTFWANSGAFSGYAAGRIENCVNLGTVRGMSTNIGGIAGQLQRNAVITGCRNDGLVVSGGNYPGGIAGYSYSLIENCLNNGIVRGDSINPAHNTISSGNYAGGIVGNLYGGQIRNCVNQGSIRSPRVAGGIFAYSSSAITVSGCLNTGTVTGGKGYNVGAIGGDKPATTAVLADNCYDGQLMPAGAVANGTAPGCSALETSALTDGNAIAALTDSLYDYAAGMYPVLKAHKDAAATRALRNVYMTLPKGMTIADITADAALHAYDGLTWSIASGSDAIYSIAGNTLKVGAPAEKKVQHGTVSAAVAGLTRSYGLTTVPDMFDGHGTPSDPYLIRTKADMTRLADLTNDESLPFAGKHFLLCNDIDYANDTAYVQIGRVTPFAGNFNGNGKSILNLSVRHISDMALFGTIKEGGSLTGLTLRGGTFTAPATGRGAGFVNKCEGTVDNCVNYNTIDCGPDTKGSYAAGIVYEVLDKGVVSNCVNYGAILGRSGTTGGIIGSGARGSLVTDCQNHGTITVKSTQWGGIAGKTSGTIRNCLNDVDLRLAFAQCGGIVGYLSDTARIENCVNRGMIEYPSGSSSAYMGGIIGRANGYSYVSGCVNYGAVECKTTGTTAYVGGIVGDGQKINIRSTVNHGNVSGGSGQYAGGIAGYMYMTGSGWVGYLDSCYNYGSVTSGHKYVAGIVGYQRGDYLNTDCGNYGTVTGTGSKANSDNTAGFTGYSYGDFLRCFNVGDVTAKGVLASGFLGEGSGNLIKECFNAGTVTSTATTGASASKPSAVGFWATGRCDTLANCYNLGAVSGYNFVSGFIGNFNSKNVIRGNYVSAPLSITTDGGSSAAFMLTVAPSTTTYADNYWDNTLMAPTGGNTTAAKGVATTELYDFAPTAAFNKNPYCYPVLKSMAGNAAANFFAAQVQCSSADDNFGDVKHHLNIGLLEGVTWTCSSELEIRGNYVRILKKDALGTPAWLEKKAAPELARRYNLTINIDTGVDGIDGGDNVLRTEYYTPDGLAVLRPADGQVLIVKTVYTDGTATVRRIVYRK